MKKKLILLSILFATHITKTGGSSSKPVTTIQKEIPKEYIGFLALNLEKRPMLVGSQEPSTTTFLEPKDIFKNNDNSLKPSSLLLPIKAWTEKIEPDFKELFFQSNSLEGRIIPAYLDFETLKKFKETDTLALILGKKTFKLTIAQKTEECSTTFEQAFKNQIEKVLEGNFSYIASHEQELIEKKIIEENQKPSKATPFLLTQKFRAPLEEFLKNHNLK